MRNLPSVTKNLLLVNLFFFLLDMLLRRSGIDLSYLLGLHYISAPAFHLWQPITYMFMHANVEHLFCNMLAVFFFGPVLENEWGEKKYLLYYMVCGLGATVTQELVWWIRIHSVLSGLPLEYVSDAVAVANVTNQLVTIGASGAVFGILFAFGWLFPNAPMFILFIPIPIRARVLVIIYAVYELFSGLLPSSGDNVAHFAHLGGLLFGWLLLLWWKHGFDFRSIRFPWSRHKRLDGSKDKDYSSYHYQKPLD